MVSSGGLQKKVKTLANIFSKMAEMKIVIMKKDELLTLIRHMKIPNKSTADANELRDALRENGAIDDKDQITLVGRAALARRLWKKGDIIKEFTNRGISRRSKNNIDDLVALGVECGFLDDNYHVIGGQGDEAGPSEPVQLIPEPDVPDAYKKDNLLEIANKAGLKGLQNTSQDRILQILKDHNLVARNSVIAPKTRPDVSVRLSANYAIKRQAREATAAAEAATAAVIARGNTAEGAVNCAEGAVNCEGAEGAGTEGSVAVPISERFSSIKLSLNSLRALTQEGHLLPICDAVNAIKKLTIRHISLQTYM